MTVTNVGTNQIPLPRFCICFERLGEASSPELVFVKGGLGEIALVHVGAASVDPHGQVVGVHEANQAATYAVRCLQRRVFGADQFVLCEVDDELAVLPITAVALYTVDPPTIRPAGLDHAHRTECAATFRLVAVVAPVWDFHPNGNVFVVNDVQPDGATGCLGG